MRAVLLFLVLCVVAFAQEKPSTPKPEAPSTAPIAYDAITFAAYDLQIRIEPSTKNFFVRGYVVIRNDSSAPLSRAAMQVSSSLRWASIKFNGEPIEFDQKEVASDVDHTGAVTEAAFKLTSPLKPGESVKLEIGYAGKIERDARRLIRIGAPKDKALLAEWDGISEESIALRGVGYATWYPVAIEPAIMIEGTRVFQLAGKWKLRHSESSMHVELSIEAEKPLVVVSNGEVATKQGTATGITFGRFGMDVPVLLAGDFDKREADRAGIYALKLSSNKTSADTYANAVQAMSASFVQNRTAKLVLVQAPENISPFESGTLFFVPFAKAKPEEIQQFLVHSMTHAAFYSPRAWINEGVAHLAQARAIEIKLGREATLRFVGERQSALAIVEPDDPAKAEQSLVTAYDEMYYRTKALYVWWMLRDIVGEDALVHALNKYRREEDKEPSYIQRLIEAESKKDLEWFFSDWVYRDRGLPEFKIDSVFSRQDLRGGYLVTVTVDNSGYAAAEVLVRIRTRGGDTWVRVEVKGKSKGIARINLPQPPTQATVNDGSVPETDPSDNTFTVPIEEKK